MNKKIIFPIVLAGGSLMAVLVLKAAPSVDDFQKTLGVDSNVISLQSGDISGLSDQYGDGTFTYITQEGNEVGFEYKYGKASNGNLIILGNSKFGNATAENFYVGNTLPITGINNITVSFSGAPYLALFGSIDGNNYYKLDVFTDSHLTSTYGTGYFYYRFVSGAQNKEDVTIESIEMTYTCQGYSDENSDYTSRSFQKGDTETITMDRENFVNGLNSTQSAKVTSTVSGSSSANCVFPIGRTLLGAELKHMFVEFYVDTSNNPSVNGKTYSRINIFGSKSWSRSSASYQTANIANGTTWTKHVVPLSNVGLVDDSEYDSIYFRMSYVNEISFDQLRIYYGNTYPELPSELQSTYEDNDLSNSKVLFCDKTYDLGNTNEEASINSIYSRKVHYVPEYGGRFVMESLYQDLSGKKLSFDMKWGEGTPSSAYIQALLLKYNTSDSKNYRYELKLKPADLPNGVTCTELDNGWLHFEIIFDTAISGLTGKAAAENTNYGFNGQHVPECDLYIDNLTIR